MVTFADSPGSIGPVVHEPSRAAIVCAVFPVLTNVTDAPGATLARAGLNVYSSWRSTRRLAVRIVCTTVVVNSIFSVSTMRPSQGCTVNGAGGAGRGGTAPPSLNAHTILFIVNATYCS